MPRTTHTSLHAPLHKETDWLKNFHQDFRAPNGEYMPANQGRGAHGWSVWAVQPPVDDHHKRVYYGAILTGGQAMDPSKFLLQKAKEGDGRVEIRWTERAQTEYVLASEVVLLTNKTDPPNDIPPTAGPRGSRSGSGDAVAHGGDTFGGNADEGVPDADPEDAPTADTVLEGAANEENPVEGLCVKATEEPWGRARMNPFENPRGEPLPNVSEDVTLEDLEKIKTQNTKRDLVSSAAEARKAGRAAAEHASRAARASAQAVAALAEASGAAAKAAAASATATSAAAASIEAAKRATEASRRVEALTRWLKCPRGTLEGRRGIKFKDLECHANATPVEAGAVVHGAPSAGGTPASDEPPSAGKPTAAKRPRVSTVETLPTANETGVGGDTASGSGDGDGTTSRNPEGGNC